MAERFAVLGTAGHIDHGKTALVRLLTGVDTDRLKEEKERGISIDLGFAHLDLPGGTSCGIVDVPGHERFVKNMLAGACGVDAVLLVIAADEGVMPQTREHLDILDLLQVKKGVVALTKIDMVDEEWLLLVTESVKEDLEEHGFGSFPLVPVSSKTGEGRDALIEALGRALDSLETRPASLSARLPVDRAFTVEGFGSVVTGTLWRGSIRPGDRLVVEPGGIETRARTVQVHGKPVEDARAGQRTAVSLAGVATTSVPRGSWVLEPGSLEPSHMLDVRLRVLGDAPKPIRNRQRVRFHLGASEILGRVVLLEGDEAPPGASTLAQIRLEAAVVADRGDRFVLRRYSPARAIAGGVVIGPRPPKRKRLAPESLEEIRRDESGSAAERLLAAVAKTKEAMTMAVAARMAGVSPADAEEASRSLVASGRLIVVAGGLLAARETLGLLEGKALEVLGNLHTQHPLRWGTSRGELKSRLGSKLNISLFDGILAALVADGRALVRGDLVRSGTHVEALPAHLVDRLKAISQSLEQGGLTPPTSKEMETSFGFSPLDCLEHLTFEGRAVKLSPELYLSSLSFEKLRTWLPAFFKDHPELTVGDLREGLGLSRKYSVPLLEYLDKLGWTRRVGDVRVSGRVFVGSETRPDGGASA